MSELVFTYDEASDTLYISFAPDEAATGIELTDHILLRVNKRERRAIGLTLLDYSILTQTTDIAPRSFPLTGLDELSDDLREVVLNILLHPPVHDILSLSAYTPSLAETIPIISLQPLSITASTSS
jgi:uncharacterized protein YuzE